MTAQALRIPAHNPIVLDDATGAPLVDVFGPAFTMPPFLASAHRVDALVAEFSAILAMDSAELAALDYRTAA